ncbi:MAG: ammonium transporter [Acidaminococcales bacterium]|jgi:Amt family ammonium transporter|nr:ammonium transporter [Acidaminococcales bacterium]
MEQEIAGVARNLNIMWTLIAGMLVFWMQAGFAMVESGLCRSKNTCNILMKNLMDFSIGSILYYLVGFGIMFGASYHGLFGVGGFWDPTGLKLGVFEDLTPATYIFFQTVFCATAATIVSGAMAERTKFIAYILYSIAISLFIYPISGHWGWGGGWLAELGFVDFAGSTIVHSVGGWAALVGAWLVGPRMGKYKKNGQANVIPGHNLTFTTLGVFILWLGWFGFNPGSTLAANDEIGHIAMTTNLAAAAGSIAVLALTWKKYGKPDVSMTLNGVLAGLVGITAGCQVITLPGSVLVGIICGFVVTYGVEFMDKVLHVDDPVGAIPVHCFCGVAGTLLTGLLANYAPGTEGAVTGLFYGGGFALLKAQIIGVAAVAAWTLATAYLAFKAIDAAIGLRVSKENEIDGLDQCEHGIMAYPDIVLGALGKMGGVPDFIAPKPANMGGVKNASDL